MLFCLSLPLFSASLFTICLSSMSLICCSASSISVALAFIRDSSSVTTFFISSVLVVTSFIYPEIDSNLLSTPASILIIVILNSGSDILLVSVLIKSLAVVSSCFFLWGEFLRFFILKEEKELVR